jgi:signal transduction histidine kinase
MLELLDETVFRRGSGVPGRVWERAKPLAVSDLWDESGAHRAIRARLSGLHGVVAFPVIDSAGTVLRVLEFFARHVRQVDAEQLETLRHIGREIGRWIERKQVERERASLQELLVKKGREWSMTFDAIDSPIFIVDADGAITRLNRAARQLAGATAYQDLLGRRVAELAAGEPWTTLGRMAALVNDTGKAADAQIASGRRRFDVSATVAPAGNESRLTAMGELVAGVAHEVRNPLFGMSATLDTWELLKDDPESPVELIPALRKWIDRLNMLMERLLDYGKVSNMVLTEGPLRDVIDAAVDACHPLAEQERITIVREVPEEVPAVRMDSSRLVQAVENLIINAIQHSPAGGTIRVRVRTRDDERVECTVTDSGPGFAPDDMTRVFQPFFTRRRGGTGLGLSIVSRVVEEHGGTIAAANAAGGGAEVTMFLPAPAADPEDVRSSH